MFKSPSARALAAILFAASGLAAAPALAKSKAGDGAMKMTIRNVNGQTRYCFTDSQQTGSHTRRDICQSREAWARDGVNIPETKQATGETEQAADES